MTTPPSLSVSSVSFDDTYVNQSSSGLALLYAGDRPRRVTITIDGDYCSTVEGERSLSKNASLSIPLTFEPTSGGSLDGKITITFKDTGANAAAPLEITLSGVGRDPQEPSFGVAADQDFANIDVGADSTCPVQIVNPEDSGMPAADQVCNLTLSLESATGFKVVPAGSQSVAAGATFSTDAEFTPPAAQSYEATLVVGWTRAGQSGELRKKLKGVGVEPPAVVDDDDPPAPDPTPDPDIAVPTGTSAGSSGGSGTGQKQRAFLYVPSWDSYLSLGAAYPSTGTKITQNGFTAKTNRHVFLKASGSVTFQAEGQVWLQSEKDHLYTVSGGNTYLVAKSNTYIGGGGYVGLMAGFAGAPVSASNDFSDADPSTPAPITSIAPAFVASDYTWQIADKVVNLATLAKTIEHAVYLGTYKGALTATILTLQTLAQIGGAAAFIYSKAAGTPQKSLNLYSAAGLLAGTPAFCSIYGTLGVNYRSANITLLGNVAVAVSSLVMTTLDSVYGDTAVGAGTGVTAECWKNTFFKCTLGPLNLYGKTIQLGGASPDGGQLPTQTLDINATGAIDLEASAPSVSKVELTALPLTGAKVSVGATTKATMESTAKTVIKVADVWIIEATPGSISIKNAAGEVLKLSPAMITIGPAGGQIKVLQSLTDLGSGTMKITSSNISTMVTHTDLL